MRHAPFLLVFLIMGIVSCDSPVQEPTDVDTTTGGSFSWVPNTTDDTTFAVTSDVHVTVVTDGPFLSVGWDRRELRLQNDIAGGGQLMLQSDAADYYNAVASTVLICAVSNPDNGDIYITVPRAATVTHYNRPCRAADALLALESEVRRLAGEGKIEDGLANSLISKLAAAKASIEADRPSAANQLVAFTKELEGNQNILRAEDAENLIALAEQVVLLLST